MITNFYKVKHRQKGQVLLIVILTLVVALTIGLSIASRSISNIKISKQNEESQKAFQAAEAGVQQALRQLQSGENISGGDNNLSNQSSYSVEDFEIKETRNNGGILINNGEMVDQAVGHDIWLSDYPSYANPPVTRTLTIYWGENTQNRCSGSGSAIDPALELLLLFTPTGNVNNPDFRKYVVDPCARVQSPENARIGAGRIINGVTFRHSYVLNITGATRNGLIVKAIPIYNATLIAAAASPALPAQGKIIASTGVSGDTARKVEYFIAYPQIPNELFPYAIISQ